MSIRIRPMGWSWVSIARQNQSNIPSTLEDIFDDETIRDSVVHIRKIRSMVEKYYATWNPFLPPAVLDKLDEVESMLSGAIPFGVCPTCHGESLHDDPCLLCMSQGWIPVSVSLNETDNENAA